MYLDEKIIKKILIKNKIKNFKNLLISSVIKKKIRSIVIFINILRK